MPFMTIWRANRSSALTPRTSAPDAAPAGAVAITWPSIIGVTETTPGTLATAAASAS